LGFGQRFASALPGRVGITDVQDCKLAIDRAVERLHCPSVFLYGGSHGGFLAAHLVGQFPELASAAVLVNPVLNLTSKNTMLLL